MLFALSYLRPGVTTGPPESLPESLPGHRSHCRSHYRTTGVTAGVIKEIASAFQILDLGLGPTLDLDLEPVI